MIEFDKQMQSRYPEVEAFTVLMRRELFANRSKGDQVAWRAAKPNDLAYDISWHLVKLVAAIKDNDRRLVEEYTADIANLAMMTLESFIEHY